MRVEFYHVDAFEAANYEPIWHALRALGVDAQMVAVPGRGNTADADWFDFDRLTAYYRARGVPWVTEPDHDAVAITTQNESIIHPYRSPRIRLAYGPVMYPDAWGLQPHSIAPFDAVLVHGPAYVDIYSQWKDRAYLPIVGYPRYDDFFAGRIDRAAIARAWNLDPSRPTVAYLPTWGENSTFDAFFAAVQALSLHCNVIVRPHHCTLRFEPARWETMRRSGLLILDNAYDLSAVYAVADVVLADTRSGGLFEAIMAERPSVGLVLDPAEVDRWIAPARVHEIAPICTAPGTLGQVVAELLQHDDYVARRRTWAEQRVSFRDGTAARHAAEAIVRLAEPTRGKLVTRRAPRNGAAPRVSAILPALGDRAGVQQSIASVLQQTYSDYELIVADDGSAPATTTWLDGIRHPRIRVVRAPSPGRCAALLAALREAGGTYVVSVTPHDFLAPLLLDALVAALDAEPSAPLAFSSIAWTDDAGAIADVQHTRDVSYRTLLTGHAAPGPFLYRQAALARHGSYDDALGDDAELDLWLRLTEYSSAVQVPEVLCYRRQSAAPSDANRAAFHAAVRRNDGFRGLTTLYPMLALCHDVDAAACHAWLDFAALLLTSPHGPTDLTAMFLERARTAAPPSSDVTSDLIARIEGTLDEAVGRGNPHRRYDAPGTELLRRERLATPVRAWTVPR